MYYQIHELRSDVVKSTRFKKLLETIRKVRRKRNSRFDGKDTKLRLLVASLEAMSEHHEAKIQELRMISEKLALMKRITGEKILSALGEVNEQCGAMAKLTKPLEDCADSIRRLEEKTRPVDQILCVLSRYAEVSATQLFPDAVDLNRVLQTVMHLKKDPLTECKASIKHDLLPVIQGHEDQIKLLFEMLLDLLMQSGNRSSPALSVASRSKENGYVLEFSYHTALLTTTDFPQTNDFKITNENLTAFSSVSIQLSLGSKIAEANSGRFWYGTDVNNGLKIYLHLLSN